MPITPVHTRRKMPVAPITAEDLLLLNIPNKRTELVRGMLIVRALSGAQHGFVTARIASMVGNYAGAHDLGTTVAAGTGFKLFSDPDTVRAPDVAFIAKAQVPTPMPDGYAALAPNLVVEVLSPRERPGEVLGRIGDWLEAGCELVWAVDPVRRTARIYRANGTESAITESDALSGEHVLPGFAFRLAEVL